MLVSSEVDRGLESRSGQANTVKLVFVARRVLRRKSKHWLNRNRDNVSEWSGMSTRGLLFQ